MVGLSWPLWVDGGGLPQVPFIAGWDEPGLVMSSTRLAILMAGLTAVVASRWRRWAWLASSGCLIWSILGDQNRLQPWVQQYLVVAVGMVLLPHRRVLGLARWYVVVLYAASGLSKLDASFVDELGALFLRTIGHQVGLAPEGWPAAVRVGTILAMPLGEILLAVALVRPETRAIGLAGSVAQHLLTVAILGPWALGHSTIVLAWNGAMIVENLALFGRTGGGGSWRPGGGSLLAAGTLVIALVTGERWGWVDSWPAHALYASHAERTAIAWPDTGANDLPPEIRAWLGPADEMGYRRLDLTGWSRSKRGVPIYPQNRVACGVAEALVGRYADPTGLPVRVVLIGRAGIGRRSIRARVECINLASLRRRGERFWLNAHPAPGWGRPAAPSDQSR